MADTPQSVYAKCLSDNRGYPLWFPEPSTSLPQTYQRDGLQIGDVGVIDQKGSFDVLFNICHNPKHGELHQRNHKILAGLSFDPVELDMDEVDVRANAETQDRVIMSSGITRVSNQPSSRPDDYEFVPTCAKGAILILPHGATCHDLRFKEEFREVAMNHALEWYGIAWNRYGESMKAYSLYLITGFYKARSWSLASFNDPSELASRSIKVPRLESESGNTTGRGWDCSFPVDYRDGPRSMGNANQTVYISGFKIAVKEDIWRWWVHKPEAVVESVPSPAVRQPCYCVRFLKQLFGQKQANHFRRGAKESGTIEHLPLLSPPFHPADAINLFLLKQNPDALAAVMHDSEWISMIETGEITLEDLAQTERLEQYLTENYCPTSPSEYGTVSLQHKIKGARKSDSGDDHSPGVHHESTHNHEGLWHPLPSKEKLQVVITHIRAENVAASLRRMPVGFCVLVEFDGAQRRTKNKEVRISDRFTEWDDVVVLPSEPSTNVRISVCASFEFSPMLGKGEEVHSLEKSVDEWLDNTRLITFSPREGRDTSRSSLLITVERRKLNYMEAALSCGDDTNVEWEAASKIAQETDLGHMALLRYQDDPTQENLDISVRHLELARDICPPNHGCRVAVLRNLAMARILNCQTNGTYANLDMVISLYREALSLCRPGDPDRPGTLVYLAQALVHCYDKQGHEASVAEEVKTLMAEVKISCPSDSHEHRAAELVLQTCETCKSISSSSSVDLDKLITHLDSAIKESPSDYFDKPQRMHNLALVLFRRFELRGEFGDLERSITIHEESMILASASQRLVFAILGVSFLRRSERVRDPTDLSGSPLDRFEQTGDLGDLEKSIVMMEESLQLLQDIDPDRPGTLINLGQAYFRRFHCVHALAELDRAISTMEKALQVMPEDHPNRPEIISNLTVSFRRRLERTDDPADREKLIAISNQAARPAVDDHHSDGEGDEDEEDRPTSDGEGDSATSDV